MKRRSGHRHVQREVCVRMGRRQLSLSQGERTQETHPAVTFILNIQPPPLQKNKFPLFKPLCLWHFEGQTLMHNCPSPYTMHFFSKPEPWSGEHGLCLDSPMSCIRCRAGSALRRSRSLWPWPGKNAGLWKFKAPSFPHASYLNN